MGDRNKENALNVQNMPNYLNVIRFAEARAQEVRKMICDLTETNGTKLIFQTLPKHMRRRTMSHKMKRLPHKHREGHLNQLKKSGMPIKTKRPSRKFRRKPSNLLSEYNRRTKRISWLETHIWHAKRFHMVEKWGYKLPFKSCDKTFRSCYRASAKYCLLQDISYYHCLEVNGNQMFIIERLKLVTNESSGLTFGARAFINGQREGVTTFYHKDANQFGAIGQVRFIWDPTKKRLWLWFHPLLLSNILKNLKEVFELTNISPEKYINETGDISVTILKNFFNRFRLTGPLSNAVISNVFKAPSPQNSTQWFDTYLNCDDNRQIFSDQCDFLKKLKNIQSPSEISPHSIINFITIDPRFNFPQKRTKSTYDCERIDSFVHNDSYKFGKIWEVTKDNFVEKNKMSTSQFLKDRTNMIITDEKMPDSVPVLPIMIIQRPGVSENNNLLGYGSGWDIIVPPGWALPVWLCLIMWGAKVGGLRETDSIQYEMARYDTLPPDTKAGEIENDDLDNKHRIKYFKLPPAKRINYNKFSICSPFQCNWPKLIAEWNDIDRIDNFYVLRNRLILAKIQEIIKSNDNNNKIDQFINILIGIDKNCLIPMKLSLMKKGKASRYSIICLPEEKDLKKLKAPVEPKRIDPFQKERNKLRKEHQTFLKRSVRKRSRAKKKGQVVTCPIAEINDFHSKLQKLWLPDAANIKDSCSRKVIGFVTKGDVSFITGCGQSIGFIPIMALCALMKVSQTDKVLVRNTNSRQYRFAKLDVICTNV